MATVGQWNYPQDYYMWYIEGDDLIIVTKESESGSTVKGYLQSPQETVTNGILISFNAEPDAVSSLTSTLDLDNTLHKYIIEYVKAELFMEEAGKAAMAKDTDRFTMLERASLRHKDNYTDELVKYGSKKRDKTGGHREIVGRNWT